MWVLPWANFDCSGVCRYNVDLVNNPWSIEFSSLFLQACNIVYWIDSTQYADPSALTIEDVSDHGTAEEEEETETKFWINNFILFLK